MQSNKCPKCGKEVTAMQTYCPGCGGKLVWTEEERRRAVRREKGGKIGRKIGAVGVIVSAAVDLGIPLALAIWWCASPGNDFGDFKVAFGIAWFLVTMVLVPFGGFFL